MNTEMCNIKDCGREIYMGWRPLSIRFGYKICEYHWKKHKDKSNAFNLYEVFGIKQVQHYRKSMSLKTF